MIKLIPGYRKPDMDEEDMITHYDICSEYWHSYEFFDFLIENCKFTKDCGVVSVKLPKDSDFFEESLFDWADGMGYDFDKKELAKEWEQYYDPNDYDMKEKLIEEYIESYW